MNVSFYFFLVATLAFLPSAFSSSKADNRMNALLHRKGSFSLKSYEDLRNSGATFSPRHLKYYSSCEDPMGFLAAIVKRGYVPTAVDIFQNFDDETLFEFLYVLSDVNVCKTALFLIINDVCTVNYDFSSFIKVALNLGSKAGKLGISCPRYAPYFVDLIQYKPETISVDFLNFLHNGGINFNSPVFLMENFFGATILEERFDLADYLADHGAKLSKTAASYMTNSFNSAKLQKFVQRRAWSIIRDIYAGLGDSSSLLQDIPHDMTKFHIVKMIMDSVATDLF